MGSERSNMGSRVGGVEAEQQVEEPGKQSEQEQGEGTHPSSTTRSIARYLKGDLLIRIIIRVHVAIVESILRLGALLCSRAPTNQGALKL